MDIEMIMGFLSNFNISRQGNYGVPKFILEESLKTYSEDGNLDPLMCYEKVVHASWIVPDDGYYLTIEDLLFIESFLAGEEYWLPEQIINPSTIDTVSRVAKYSREQNHLYSSYKHRRRESLRVTGKAELREQVFKKSNYKCVKCKSPVKLTIDHIKPVLKGGGDEVENLQTLCRPCNSSKGAR